MLGDRRPDTHLFTGSVTLHFDPGPEMETRFAEIEAGGRDVNTFVTMVGRDTGVARLSDAGRDVLSASPRLADIYRPLGFVHELRTTFVLDERCWGVAGLLRGSDGSDFSDHEVRFVDSVRAVVAAGLRAAVGRATDQPVVDAGSNVVVLGHDLEVLAATPQAEQRLLALDRSGRAGVGPAVRSVVAAVAVQGAPRARARLRDAAGGWMTLTATPMRTRRGEEQVALTIEPTHPWDLTELLLSAHGLTRREQDVCRQALAGRSTSEIAAELYISANTVQDHLKSIFAKTGLRSRRELVAHLSRAAR